MVSTPCPPCMSHLVCVCVSVHVLTGLPARDLSAIIALLRLFTGSLIPPCLLSLSVYVLQSPTFTSGASSVQELAKQTLKICLGLPF